MSVSGRILLKKGRDGPVRGGNPWVFSQAIARAEPSNLAAGDLVEVFDIAGNRLGIGYFNPATTIAVRILDFGPAATAEDIVGRRLRAALEFRRRIIPPDTNCYRLINGDGDGLSGVVIDIYGDVSVVQLLTTGADRMRGEIVEALETLLSPRAIIERSQGAVRKEEGLSDRGGVIRGELVDEALVTEHGLRFAVDVLRGQKTGFFLDQRENRAMVRQFAKGARVFDGYCYTGGFSMAASAGGAAHVVASDSSARALDTARRNLELNDLLDGRCELVHGEAARYLAAASQKFDIIIMDPPPLARSAADAPRAAQLYIDLNVVAMRALEIHGLLMTFSCSVHFGADDLLRAVRIAQTKAATRFSLVRRLGPAADHPVMLGHREGEYLTGLLLARRD